MSGESFIIMEFWRYTMKLRMPPNARTTAHSVEGALVRIGGGTGCLHPWEELGDPSLDDQLVALKTGNDTGMTRQCRYCCALDAAARSRGTSIFADVEIPSSHGIWFEGVEEARLENLEFLKMKCGPDVVAEAARLKEVVVRLPEARWRIDFNATLDRDSFLAWRDALGVDLLEKIDLVEDPMPIDAGSWDELQAEVPFDLAADREKNPARVKVVKPLLDEVDTGASNCLVTSYMDHPIGQCFAALIASRFSEPLRGSGLLTHWLFEDDPFVERMRDSHGVLLAPEGTGLGFDDLLDDLPWKTL